MIPQEENKDKKTLKLIIVSGLKIFRILWREARWIFLAMLFSSSLISLVPFIQSWSQSAIINDLTSTLKTGFFTKQLIMVTALYIGVRFLSVIVNSLFDYVHKLNWYFIDRRFEIEILRKKASLDVATLEDPQKNNLISKVSENLWRVKNFTDRLFYTIESVIQLVVASAIIVQINWRFFPVLFLGIIPEFFVEMKFGRTVWGMHDAHTEVNRRFWNIKNKFDDVTSLIELKIFRSAKNFIERLKLILTTFQNKNIGVEKKRLAYRLISKTFSQAIMSVVIILFVKDVLRGEMKIGTFLFAVASIGSLRDALSGFFRTITSQYEDSLFIKEIFDFFELKPEIERSDVETDITNHEPIEIVFENVSFSYPNSAKEVLSDFSLKINKGERVAVVGVNGAGKTTLVKLLCRFYDPRKGRILINGVDIKNINLESFYNNVGAIFQEYNNYQFPVKEAIGVGRVDEEIEMDHIENSAKASEAHDFINEWEGGYDQMLGKQFTGGVEPSVGQWQKLALARTFYRKPKLLVLDEPTASVDAEGEAKIFNRLHEMKGEATMIIISHRFSTVRQADKIAVIDGGRLSEYGTHNELIVRNGMYAKLFRLQAKGYE